MNLMVILMSSSLEHRVRGLAHRVGLRLVIDDEQDDEHRYRLVEPMTMTPVSADGGDGGARLDELESWLEFPWE
jgi:hypothetical protein